MGGEVLVELMRKMREENRGVVREAHQTLAALFEEREPLYRKYADVSVDCIGLNHEQAAIAIVAALNAP